MCLLGAVVDILPEFLTLPEDVLNGVEYLLDRVETIGHEVAEDVALLGLGVVVAVEGEDPVGIKMGVDRHMEGIGGQVHSVAPAIVILTFGVTGIAA